MSEQKPLDKVASFLGIEVIKNRMNTYSKEDNFLTLEELELYRKKFLEKEPIFDNKHFIGSILDQP